MGLVKYIKFMLKYSVSKKTGGKGNMRIKIILFLLCFICFHTVSYGESTNTKSLSNKTYWGGSSPKDVAARANRMPSLNPSASSDDSSSDSIINPLGSLSNMLQMVNTSTYNAVEQQKQQVDYVKQQIEY